LKLLGAWKFEHVSGALLERQSQELSCFSAINNCFSFGNYNDLPRRWELNSLSLCTIHLFRFRGAEGGETKQRTLDVLDSDRRLPLGMLSPSKTGHNLKPLLSSPSELLVINVTMCRENHDISLSSASHEHNKIVHLVLDRILLCTLDNLHYRQHRKCCHIRWWPLEGRGQAAGDWKPGLINCHYWTWLALNRDSVTSFRTL